MLDESNYSGLHIKSEKGKQNKHVSHNSVYSIIRFNAVMFSLGLNICDFIDVLIPYLLFKFHWKKRHLE